MKQILLKGTLVLVVLAILLDLGFLNWMAFKEKKSLEPIREIEVEPSFTPSPISLSTCPASCLSLINEATMSIRLPTPAPSIKTTPVGSSVKEFFISFGSGSTRAGDWEDVGGLGAYIDSGKYGKIKSVVFEAAVAIPNGNQGVYVRLFNATDKHPVWFSEVYHEGGNPKLLISSPITLDAGNKLYQAQMKTTLKDLANLNQARIKITVD